jgi:ATP/maltotriose-dependent transcriptional regulator MalT
VERPVSLPDGSSKWSNVRVYPVFDKKGNVVYAVKILIDITNGKLIGARQKRHVELLENTIQAMNRKNVRNFFQDEGGTSKGILTGREIEVLGLISNGLSNVKIGEILDISPHTVKSHVMNIFDKLGVKGRTQAAVWTVRNQLN